MRTAPVDEPAVPSAWTAGFELPRYSLWRRVPEWEPRGRWLHDRPQVEWPDTLFSITRLPWVLRLILIVSMGLGLTTMDGGSAEHWTVAILLVALGSWMEWWQTWDLTPIVRRVTAISVQGGLTAAVIALSPLGGLMAWTHYLICGTFFTGPLLVASVSASCALIVSVQVGGFEVLSRDWALSIGLFVFDIAIGLASIMLASRREEAVRRRNATANRLLAEQQKNSELHQQLMDQAREAGIREERARLARDLHDTVAQGLVAVITQLEAVDDTSVSDPATRKRLDHAKALAREGLSEARRAVHALGPIALEQDALPAALADLAREWSAVNHIDTQVVVSGEPRPHVADPVLMRVVQEALSNVARHSKARTVAVNLDYLEDEVLLDIHDDGTGFDPSKTRDPSAEGGHGLPGMVERLRACGGRLDLETEPGAGTVISAAVPG